MTKAKKIRKHSWFDYQGLPIAALSLVFLIVFLLIAVNLTRVEENEDNVQGVVKTRSKAVKTVKATKETALVDSLILQIDSLLKSNNRFSDNLVDIK